MIRSLLRSRSHRGGDSRSYATIYLAGITSLVAYALLQWSSYAKPLHYSEAMIEAAALMQSATHAVRDFCDSTGIEIDEVTDPNATCLIGPELTPLMTTLGHLDAKRTTTDPAMASLIAHLLDEAGVSEGDTIAIGSSASFPALLIGTVAAAEAMSVHPVIILSLGASTYGATNPEFNLLDMYTLLIKEGVFATPAAAVSLGGGEDIGTGFDAELTTDLSSQIAESGLMFLSDSDLRGNVAARMAIYGRVAAFVNTGGSYANLGTSAEALQLQPGLSRDIGLPPVEERGVLFEMAALEVPVIHLLFIRGLVSRHGVVWDPIPHRKPGEMALYAYQPGGSRAVWLVGIPYFIAVVVLVVAHARCTSRSSQTAHDITL